MKRHILIGIIFTQSLLNIAHADFLMRANDHNSCSTIAGSWEGQGRVADWWGACSYQGSGTITQVNDKGNFTLNVTARKISGNLFCPNDVSTQLTGSCVNNIATIKTHYGNLSGSFSDHAGEASGRLEISLGIKADVAIQFRHIR